MKLKRKWGFRRARGYRRKAEDIAFGMEKKEKLGESKKKKKMTVRRKT